MSRIKAVDKDCRLLLLREYLQQSCYPAAVGMGSSHLGCQLIWYMLVPEWKDLPGISGPIRIPTVYSNSLKTAPSTRSKQSQCRSGSYCLPNPDDLACRAMLLLWCIHPVLLGKVPSQGHVRDPLRCSRHSPTRHLERPQKLLQARPPAAYAYSRCRGLACSSNHNTDRLHCSRSDRHHHRPGPTDRGPR